MANQDSNIKARDIRKGVIVSIVATLLIAFLIKPVLNFVWSMITPLGSTVAQTFVEHIYKNAALGHRNNLDYLIILLVLSVLSGLALGGTLFVTKEALISSTDTTVEEKPRIRFSYRQKAILCWLLFLVQLSTAIFLLIPSYVDLQVNTSFQQRLKVLAPSITDLEIKRFEASWALMASRSDYVAILAQMDSVAQLNGLTLPKPLSD